MLILSALSGNIWRSLTAQVSRVTVCREACFQTGRPGGRCVRYFSLHSLLQTGWFIWIISASHFLSCIWQGTFLLHSKCRCFWMKVKLIIKPIGNYDYVRRFVSWHLTNSFNCLPTHQRTLHLFCALCVCVCVKKKEDSCLSSQCLVSFGGQVWGGGVWLPESISLITSHQSPSTHSHTVHIYILGFFIHGGTKNTGWNAFASTSAAALVTFKLHYSTYGQRSV